MALERAARPSGCSRPGTPTRQSLVPGFFYSFIGKLPYILRLHFSSSNPDKLVKSPKFSHAFEGRHPELFENTGFPPSRE